MNWLLATLRISAKLAGRLVCDVQPFVDRTRVAYELDPLWSVTYAADHGKEVFIRFDREPDSPNGRMFAVQVNKATGAIRVLPKTTSSQPVNVG